MFQQYILPIIAGIVILVLLFGVFRRNFEDLLSVLFDLPEKSDSEKYEKGENHE